MTDLDDLIARLRNEVNGGWVPDIALEAAAALASLRDEVARKDAAMREHISFMESTGFSTRFLDGMRAALAGKE